jgi:hypothetical protein
MRDRRTRQELSEWVALEALACLVAAPVVLAAALGDGFDARAVVLAGVLACATVALVLRRRGAWLLLVGLYALGLASSAWDWRGAGPIALSAAVLVLLVSPPIRRHLDKGRCQAA